MIPLQFALRRRMMLQQIVASNNIAKLTPTDGKTYTSGLSGLTPDIISGMAALISNNSDITNTASTVYVDYEGLYYKLDVANQINIALNGTDYAFDIIGFNHDNLTTSIAYGDATATGKAGITFQMHDLFKTSYKMNNSATNNGGWNSSAMRTSTMAKMLSYLPSAWQTIVKPVNKLSGTGGGSTSGTQTTSDGCFLLSEMEIFGSTSLSVQGEGTKYQYYKAGGSAVKNRSGSKAFWWTRSPYPHDAKTFCVVNKSGSPEKTSGYANNSWGVAFGFCA